MNIVSKETIAQNTEKFVGSFNDIVEKINADFPDPKDKYSAMLVVSSGLMAFALNMVKKENHEMVLKAFGNDVYRILKLIKSSKK